MAESLEHRYLELISGRQRGALAGLVRIGLLLLEPGYRAVTGLRNLGYSAGWLTSRRAGCAVVSVGNITTGGTGKTPVVRWLVDRLRFAGHRPAVLLRGYKAQDGRSGDEQAMLQEQLGTAGGPPVWVHAEPDRVAGAATVLRAHPEVDVFVLDDGFQHRRLRRDFDLVLIDATRPFGFGHVLPRGLLREPLRGLRRADAFLLTHADEVPDAQIEQTRDTLNRHNPGAPVFRCWHRLTGFRRADGHVLPPDALQGQRVLAFCGIGNPESFFSHVRSLPGDWQTRAFPDHHPYGPRDLASLRHADAAALVTTEKDWVKLRRLQDIDQLPVPLLTAQLAIGFAPEDDTKLLHLVRSAISPLSR